MTNQKQTPKKQVNMRFSAQTIERLEWLVTHAGAANKTEAAEWAIRALYLAERRLGPVRAGDPPGPAACFDDGSGL